MCTSQRKNATLDYCNLAKMIEPESDEDSESSCEFAGNAEDRGVCWTAPNAQNQQNLDWGKFYGPIVLAIFNRLNFKKNKVMGGGEFNLWTKRHSKGKLVKIKLRSRDAQESDKTIRKLKNVVTIKARTVLTSRR